MGKNKTFIFSILLLLASVFTLSHRTRVDQPTVQPENAITATVDDSSSDCFKSVLTSQIGVQETSENRGIEVEKYLAYTGLEPGYAWCAAFQSYCLDQCNLENDSSAWSPTLVSSKRRVFNNKDQWPKDTGALVYGIYFPSKGRVAHVGGVLQMLPDKMVGVEGNTNAGGVREGDQVLKKIRPKNTIHAISRYTKKRNYQARVVGLDTFIDPGQKTA